MGVDFYNNPKQLFVYPILAKIKDFVLVLKNGLVALHYSYSTTTDIRTEFFKPHFWAQGTLKPDISAENLK